MSDYIKVNFESLEAGYQNLKQGANTLESHLRDLEQRIESGMLSVWNGTAQQAYQEKKQQWNRAAQDMQQVLAGIGQAVQRAHESYTTAEQSNQRLWS